MNSKHWIAGLVLAAAGFGAGLYVNIASENGEGNHETGGSDMAAPAEREILYWVAPMDANFRRDKPGKSPMGMDLVPVYADEAGSGDLVAIDPVMVQNLGVRTAIAERGPLWRRIDTVGYVGFDERRISHVHLRTEGWIEKLNVKSDGERVQRGDVLMEVYSRELVGAQEEYIQSLKSGNASMTRASRDRLLALGMGNAQVKTVERTRKADQLVKILARQSGVVTGLKMREGMYVKPATEVMTLADLSSVWLLVDVFERQADWVKVGMLAEVELPYQPGKVWEGEVEFIYPSIDPKTRTLRVRLRFENPDEALKPDMYAKVRIYAGPKKDVLSIPREALIRTGKSTRVMVALGEGRFDAREVVAGMESGDWVEILAGLEAGDRIVTSGQFLLDSEASLKASFSRMGIDDTGQENPAAPVMGMGVVNAVREEDRTLNIRHAPIAALGWPEMTMDFQLTDKVDLNGIGAGQQIHFLLVPDAEGIYRIDEIQVVE